VFLTQALMPDQAVFIRLPAAGIQTQVELSRPSVLITVPEGVRQ
jgi:hypothetical protein